MTAWETYQQRQRERQLRQWQIQLRWAKTARDPRVAAQAKREIRALGGEPA